MAGGAVAFIGFHPPGWQTVNSGLLATIRRWLGTLYHPERASLLLLFVCMVLLIALIGYVVRLVYDGRDGGSYMNGGFATFLAISLIIYLWFVVAVICFLNAITPLDERILSPAFILVLLLVMHAVNTGLLWVKRPVPLWAAIRVPAMALVVFIVSTWYSGTKLVATRFHDDGIGLNSKPWRSSKMIEASSALPADAVIYSNAPDMLYPLTRRRSKGIPRKADIVTKVADPKYPAAISQMRRELSGSNGYIIYFSARPDLPDENELRQLLPLRVIHKSRDGTIYTAQ